MFDNYCLVTEPTESAFEAAVKAKLTEGWQPHGGVAIVERTDRNACRYAQAMVKCPKHDFAAMAQAVNKGVMNKIETREVETR